MPDTGTLEYWQYGTVPVIVNTDNYDLGSLEYWQYGTVPVVYQQTSGGTTIDESLTEGSIAGDSLSATATSSITATEGAKAGDTYLDEVSSEVQESISEGVVAGDSFAVEVVSAGSVVEGAKAGDTATVIADPELSLSEGTKAGDLLYPQASGDPTYRYVFNPFTGTLDKVRAD